MSKWIEGFIAGITAGLVLAMLWDTFKIKRSARRNDNKILTAVKEEIRHNLEVIASNKKLLEEELDTIFDENNIIHPLSPLLTGFEDLLKFSISEKIISGESLVKLRMTMPHAASLNEQIKNRDAYRSSEHEVSTYYRRIKKFDESILKGTDRLRALLQELQPLL